MDTKFFSSPRTVAQAVAHFNVSETTVRTFIKARIKDQTLIEVVGRPTRYESFAKVAKLETGSVIGDLATELQKRPALVRRVLRTAGFAAPYSPAEMATYRKALVG